MAVKLFQDGGPILSVPVLVIIAIVLLIVFVYLLLRWRSQQAEVERARSLDREPVRTGISAVSPSTGTTSTPAIAPTPAVSHVPGVAAETPQAAVDIPAAPDVPADVETVDTISSAASTQAAAELLSTEPAFSVQKDDLEIIEGIGPRIAQILNEVGIISFAQLADTKPAYLRAICTNANLRMADPTTWPEQARLAANGDMEGLQAFQDRLRGGREEKKNL